MSESIDLKCPACGGCSPSVRFDGKTLWLHCEDCGSDTADATIMKINLALAQPLKALGDLLKDTRNHDAAKAIWLQYEFPKQGVEP